MSGIQGLKLHCNRDPSPPSDAVSVYHMMTAQMRDSLAAAIAGQEIGFPMRCRLRFLRCIGHHGEVMPLGYAVAALRGPAHA